MEYNLLKEWDISQASDRSGRGSEHSSHNHELFCDLCINRRLAEDKKRREEGERQRQIEIERLQLEEQERVTRSYWQQQSAKREAVRQEAQKTAQDLEAKYQERRHRKPSNDYEAPSLHVANSAMAAKEQYARDLLQQIYERKAREHAEHQRDIQYEQQELERLQLQSRSAYSQMLLDKNAQRNEMKNTLLQQIMHNDQKKKHAAIEKERERIELDHEQELYRSYHEQLKLGARGIKSSTQSSPTKTANDLKECYNCHRFLHPSQLSKYKFNTQNL